MFHHRAVCRNIWPMWPLGARLTLTAGLRSLCRCVLVQIGLASICDCGGRSSCWIGRGDEPVDAPLYSVAPSLADFATLSYNCRKLPMLSLSFNCRGLMITTLSNNCRRLPKLSLSHNCRGLPMLSVCLPFDTSSFRRFDGLFCHCGGSAVLAVGDRAENQCCKADDF